MAREVLLGALLVAVAWQLGQIIQAIRCLTVELTTARWERNQRERLKAERDEQNSLALRRELTDRA